MENWVSLLPALITILTAIFSKRIIPSLVLGLWVGSLLPVPRLHPLEGTIRAAQYIIGSVAAGENAYIILFLFTFGSLAEMFKVSGGIEGFAMLAGKYAKDEKGALLAVWATSLATFQDCCFHAISTGAIGGPLIERVKGSKEKLAIIVNITSSQLVVLIPIATTYVGYIMGITGPAMQKAGIAGSPYSLYLQSLPFNFYSLGMVIISFLVIFFGLGFGRWKLGSPGKEGAKVRGVHGESEAHAQCKFAGEVPPRISNLLLPLIFLVAFILFMFWYTGRGAGGSSFLEAVMHAEFEKAIFVATFVTVILTAIYYALQKMPMGEIESHFISGGAELLPPIVVLILSWSLAGATADLGFIQFISGTLGGAIPPLFIPAAIFLIGGFTSYFIGSSWATWALIMPLGLPLAAGAGASLPLTMGAVLAGGSIGDNISPLGETPILTAAITGIPLLDHIRTTIPYGAIVAGISAALFVLVQAIL